MLHGGRMFAIYDMHHHRGGVCIEIKIKPHIKMKNRDRGRVTQRERVRQEMELPLARNVTLIANGNRTRLSTAVD